MNLYGYISRKYLLLLFLVAFIFSALPYLYVYVKLGYQAPIIPIAAYTTDSGYYFERMQEIKDGHPFLGNPYFIEHRSDIPPAFFLADWFGSIPLLLGLPMMSVAVINLFVWSFFFLVLSFLLFRLLGVSALWGVFGSIFVYAEVYSLMIRPVSMQVIFPFFLAFLIAFLLWLKDVQNTTRQWALALFAAFTAYIYTYAWQIVIVTLLLTPILFFFTAQRDALKALLRVGVLFLCASLPLVVYSLKQVTHPLYFETMQRIGLINSHIPTAALIYVSIWIIAMFLLSTLLFRHQTHELKVPLYFFSLLGLAMIGVMSSTIITGKDLELPQHIERFVIFWFGFASVYTAHMLAKQKQFSKVSLRVFVAGALLVAVIFFGNIRYLIMGGPGIIFDQQYDFALYQKVQGFNKPFLWLRENVKEPSVIWADPKGSLTDYIVMMTPHYVLFRDAGVLHLASDEELEERYITAHYFDLTQEILEEDYWAYGGVGNAIHGWKTHNRKVRLCGILRLEGFGYECGELTNLVAWKGKDHFAALYEKYENEIKPNITSMLNKYHVKYIIHDKETDSTAFRPELISGAERVYSDGRFTIYSIGE